MNEKFVGPLPEDIYEEVTTEIEEVTAEIHLPSRLRVVEEIARERYGRKIAQLCLACYQAKYERLRIDRTSGLLAKDELADQAEQKLTSFEHGRRSSDKYNSAVLIKFDAENFKLINEKHGHPEGDRRIGIIGQFLKQNARTDEGDLIGRLGEGDEFGWLAPFDATDTDAATVLSGIEARLHDIDLDRYSDMPKLRWNHAFYNHGDTWEDLLKRADMKGEALDRTRSHSKTHEQNELALERALLYS